MLKKKKKQQNQPCRGRKLVFWSTKPRKINKCRPSGCKNSVCKWPPASPAFLQKKIMLQSTQQQQKNDRKQHPGHFLAAPQNTAEPSISSQTQILPFCSHNMYKPSHRNLVTCTTAAKEQPNNQKYALLRTRVYIYWNEQWKRSVYRED